MFKPNRVFLDHCKKATPWYRVTDTTVSAKDAENIRDYIMSGGPFQDVTVLYMYVKKLMCQETLKLYDKALNKALSEGAPHSARTIVDTLRAVMMNRVP